MAKRGGQVRDLEMRHQIDREHWEERVRLLTDAQEVRFSSAFLALSLSLRLLHVNSYGFLEENACSLR